VLPGETSDPRARSPLEAPGVVIKAGDELIAVDRQEVVDGRLRRYYRITAHGRAIARAEARRLADQVEAARAHRLLSSEKH